MALALSRTRDRLFSQLAGVPGGRAAVRRAFVQLEFAREFARGNASLEPVAQQGIELFEAGPQGDVSAWLAGIEVILQPIATLARRHKIICVGHGHIDMNWMWSWPETVSATHDTFASVLSIMREHPSVTYSQSQVAVYELTRKYHPDQFWEIRDRIHEGRWEVTAAHWVEGDKNISGGESIARHLLLSREWTQLHLGLGPKDIPVDWEPDTFGHANTIPTILAKGGVRYYYACRLGGGHGHDRVGNERPPVFWWEGPDGARVLVNQETTWYNSYVNIGENIALPAIKFFKQTGLSTWLNVFGVGNHGGGPTRAEIAWLDEVQSFPCYPTVAYGTSQGYFEAVEAEIASGIAVPVLSQELNFEFTGCYTSQSAIKRANRFGERMCLEAETVLAVQGKSKSDWLDIAWTHVLFNQFHDILPGSGVAGTREHAMGLFQEVGAITGSIKTQFTKDLAANIDTRSLLPADPDGAETQDQSLDAQFEAGVGQQAYTTGTSIAGRAGGGRFFPVVVYNPTPFARTELVDVNLFDTGLDPHRLIALDEHGRAHPTVLLHHSSSMWADWGHVRTEVRFAAVDIPPLGYRTFLFTEGEADAGVIPSITIEDDTRFRTPDWSFGLDRYRPGLVAGQSSTTGYCGGGLRLGAWEHIEERPRGMTSWILGGDERRVELPAQDYGIAGVERNGGTGRVTSHKPFVVATHRLSVPGTSSNVVVRTNLHAFGTRLDSVADIDWREIGDDSVIPGLSVRFDLPLDLAKSTVRYETPFGSVLRDFKKGEEVPTLRYVHVAGPAVLGGDKVGVTILQDSKHGFSADTTGWDSLHMRVVRSSTDPDHAPEVGRSRLRYSVLLHDRELLPSELTRLAQAWEHPLIVFSATLQTGPLPVKDSYVMVLTPSVSLSALKPSQDGLGVVLRLVELDGADVEAEVELGTELAARFAGALTVDLLESPIGVAELNGNRLRVRVPAHSVVSVKLG